MSQYDETNRGTLFKNDRKEKDNHPDYKGQINVDGTEYWLSSWIKVSKTGTKFMSLSVQPKDSAPAKKPAKQQDSGFDDVDSDLPF